MIHIMTFENYDNYIYEAPNEPDFGDIVISSNNDILVQLDINNILTENIYVYDTVIINTRYLDKSKIKKYYKIEEYFKIYPNVIINLIDRFENYGSTDLMVNVIQNWIKKLPDLEIYKEADKYNL